MSLSEGHPAVVLVGCGNMGRALLEGWLDHGLPAAAITVVEPDPARAEAAAGCGVRSVAAAGGVLGVNRVDAVVLAIKPQAMGGALAEYRPFTPAGGGEAVFLSIAAGRTIDGIAALLGEGTPIVRAMPNTPAAVRRGITVACANDAADAALRSLCETLLSAVGSVLWVDDEALLDPVTAVSGSGPAYVFLLAECLAEAGREAGLPPALADRLARETVAGSGELLAQSELSPAHLRQNVTSPSGTTAAALSILADADNGLQPLMRNAVAAATRRARELAG